MQLLYVVYVCIYVSMVWRIRVEVGGRGTARGRVPRTNRMDVVCRVRPHAVRRWEGLESTGRKIFLVGGSVGLKATGPRELSYGYPLWAAHGNMHGNRVRPRVVGGGGRAAALRLGRAGFQ